MDLSSLSLIGTWVLGIRWGFEHLGLVKGVSAHTGGLELDEL